jgi:hypothetical protein
MSDKYSKRRELLMATGKLYTLMMAPFLFTSAAAQEVTPINVVDARPHVSQFTNGRLVAPVIADEQLPVSNMPVYGNRTSGLDAPEAGAITMFFITPHAIDSLLSDGDRRLFIAASSEFHRASRSTIAFENVCRKAVAMRSQGVSSQEARELGQQLNEIDASSKAAIVEVYYAMIDKMSDAGAEMMNNEKMRIHRSIGSFTEDWEAQSQVNPEKFVETYANNCNQPQL